jgi:anti-sigma B factor antagonist
MNNDIVKRFDDAKEDSIKIRLEKIEQVPDCLALHLSGYIDSFNHPYFLRKVTMAVESGFTRLIFDMRAVHYISSAGYGSLITTLKMARTRAGDLVLQELQARVYDVLVLLGFANFFNRTDNLEESIALLTKAPPAATFPRVFACPICEVKLRASKAGRFRCSHCRTVIKLAETGAVALG